jgi:hypothetical protein
VFGGKAGDRTQGTIFRFYDLAGRCITSLPLFQFWTSGREFNSQKLALQASALNIQPPEEDLIFEYCFQYINSIYTGGTPLFFEGDLETFPFRLIGFVVHTSLTQIKSIVQWVSPFNRRGFYFFHLISPLVLKVMWSQ